MSHFYLISKSCIVTFILTQNSHLTFLSFSHLSRDGTNTLGIITFALLFGTVLGTLGERAKAVIAGFRVIDDVIMSIVRGVMWYAVKNEF